MLQKSLIKAMQLIDVMAGEQNDYGVTEIASKLQKLTRAMLTIFCLLLNT